MRRLQRLAFPIAAAGFIAVALLHARARADSAYTAADCASSKRPAVISVYSEETKRAKTEIDWLTLEIGFRPALSDFQTGCKAAGVAEEGWFAVWMGWGTAMLAQMDAKGGEKPEAVQFAGISRHWFARARRTSGADASIVQSSKKGLAFLEQANL